LDYHLDANEVEEYAHQIEPYLNSPDISLDPPYFDECQELNDEIETIEGNKEKRCFLALKLVSFHAAFPLDIFNVYLLFSSSNEWFAISSIFIFVYKVIAMFRDGRRYAKYLSRHAGEDTGMGHYVARVLRSSVFGFGTEVRRSRKRGHMTDRLLGILYIAASSNRVFSLVVTFYAFPFMVSSSIGIVTIFLNLVNNMNQIAQAAYIRFHLGAHGSNPLKHLLQREKDKRRQSSKLTGVETYEAAGKWVHGKWMTPFRHGCD
jgi:hypothetical protein